MDEGANLQAPGARRSVGDFPYRSELLAHLSALMLLWNSPAVQGQILAKTGESVDQSSHQVLRHLLALGSHAPDASGGGARHGGVARQQDPEETRE